MKLDTKDANYPGGKVEEELNERTVRAQPAAETDRSKASANPRGANLPAELFPQLRRVVVVGSAGAGKTTFARALAGILEVPHIELDAIFWLPDWTPREPDEFRSLTEEAVSRDTWVVDGNYGVVRDIVWPRAAAVIWLNYSFPLVFGRALKRTVTRIARREELFSGNRDTFRQAFLSRDSLLWWVVTTYARRRRQYRAMYNERVFTQLTWIEFQRPRQARAFLESLRATAR